MKVIFVSGKYMSDSSEGIADNIRESRRVGNECWSRGWAVICPAMNTLGCETLDTTSWERYGITDDQKSDKDDIFYSAYLEILSRCDAVIMVDNWVDSRGARAEHKYAVEHGIPVFYEREGVPHPSEVDKDCGGFNE